MTAIDRLKSARPEFEWSEVASADGAPCIEVAPESWHGLISTLRDLCGMETVVFLTCLEVYLQFCLPFNPRSHKLW